MSSLQPQVNESLMDKDIYKHRIESVLETLLASVGGETSLQKAIQYCVLGSGKRVRPLLVYATGEALGFNKETLDPIAVAIELIHTYSLVHDDLPCMDDDALRRGKPTAHIVFDEATAVLAGDALQSMAFDVLSKPMHRITAKNQLKILNILANASGSNGMVMGQAIDLAAVGKKLHEDELERMHAYKTGALIKASILMASYCCSERTNDALKARRLCLSDYADSIGLAFQVRDDILDIQSDTETLGKQQGADVAANKPTYPSIIGMDAAKQKLLFLHKKALDSLSSFGSEADLLREIAGFIIKRIA
ncbi:MAG: farnesyl diphosphate synthase [Cocleimonas sp.]